jgi:hypothetical protein
MLFTGININRAWKDDKTWFDNMQGIYNSTLVSLQKMLTLLPELLRILED